MAAVLSHKKTMFWPVAFGACLSGVLLGDFLVYLLGYVYGEKVMSLRLTRKFLTRAREAQMQGYFHRHGFKILVLGRFAVGFRTAAYLTAGILKLPVLKLFLTDLLAASLSTSFFFLAGLRVRRPDRDQPESRQILADGRSRRAPWVRFSCTGTGTGGVMAGGLRVGPKVLESLDEPLPPDDLHALSGEMRAYSPPFAAPVEPSLEVRTGPVPSEVGPALRSQRR